MIPAILPIFLSLLLLAGTLPEPRGRFGPVMRAVQISLSVTVVAIVAVSAGIVFSV